MGYAANNTGVGPKPLLQLVDEKNLTINGDGFVLMNGGFGTWLEFGNRLGETPFLHPRYNHRVVKLGQAYLESGARIIGTHTFGANAIELEKKGYSGKLKQLNQDALSNLYKSIELAKREGYDNLENPFPEEFLTYIAIGPSDCYREEPTINSIEEASEMHAPQIEALFSKDGTFGVDYIQAETNPEPIAISGLIKEIRKYDPNIAIVPSFYLSKTNGKLGLVSATNQTVGEGIDEIEQATGERLEVMINCCDMETITKGIMLKNNSHLDRIVGIYPNPHHETDYQKDHSHRLQTYSREALDVLVRDLQFLKNNYTENLTAVAICCGATPDDIAMMNSLLHPRHKTTNTLNNTLGGKQNES